ncbi:MAG: phosphate ABC transporter permease subunit PstC [Rhodospirillales bacterium]
MPASVLIFTLAALTVLGFFMGRRRAVASAGGGGTRALHSRPNYYGYYVALWCAVPAVLVLAAWSAFDGAAVDQIVLARAGGLAAGLDDARTGLLLSDIHNLAAGVLPEAGAAPEIKAAAASYTRLSDISAMARTVVCLALLAAGAAAARRRISPALRARNAVENAMRWAMIMCSAAAVLTTLGIVLSLVFESLRFFEKVPFTDFIFGLEWSPQTAIREDQVASEGLFGAVPLFAGTLLISFIAMLVAAPVGLMSAIYMSEYAAPKVRAAAKPVLEILAGVPTVVYGFFAALTAAPFFRSVGGHIGLDVSSESALAAGAVMGIMIIPFVSSLSDDVIRAVPQSMREGSYGLGATRAETIIKVLLPAALPGIVGALLLAVSRAIGETMIVVMAAGLSANLTLNPLETVTTVTVQIVTLLVGDQEFDSAKTLASFALGLVLFCVTLCLNIIALYVVKKYREQYD